MRRNAFTLVELLVVVAIIVALLAILMPSMGRAVALANRAVCASNQRQIMTAFLSYAVDDFGIWVSPYYDNDGYNAQSPIAIQSHSLYTIGEKVALRLQELGLAGGEVNTGSGSYIVPEADRPDSAWDCPTTPKPRMFGYPWNNSGNYFNVDDYMILTNLKSRGSLYSGKLSPSRLRDNAAPILAERVLTFDAGVSPVGNHDTSGVFEGSNHAWSDASVVWRDAEAYGSAFAGGTYQATGWLLDDWTAKWFWVEE